MADYYIREIDPIVSADALHWLNEMEPGAFPPLEQKHFERGYWWMAYSLDGHAAGFAGIVPMEPFPHTGFLKRGYVLPDHRGNGLQMKFIRLREQKARKVGWTTIVTDVGSINSYSQTNLERAGYVRCNPEQPWGPKGSAYYVKRL